MELQVAIDSQCNRNLLTDNRTTVNCPGCGYCPDALVFLNFRFPELLAALNALRDAMTGRKDAPTQNAVLVIDNIKQVFCVLLSSSSRLVDSFVILVASFSKKCIRRTV